MCAYIWLVDHCINSSHNEHSFAVLFMIHRNKKINVRVREGGTERAREGKKRKKKLFCNLREHIQHQTYGVFRVSKKKNEEKANIN